MFHKVLLAVVSFSLLSGEKYPPAPSHKHAGPIQSDIIQSFATDCGAGIGRYSVSLTMPAKAEAYLSGITVDGRVIEEPVLSEANRALRGISRVQYATVECINSGLAVQVTGSDSSKDQKLLVIFVASRRGLDGIRTLPAVS